MRIDGRVDTPDGRRFHGYYKEIIRRVIRYLTTKISPPEKWLEGPDIEEDQNFKVLMKLRNEYLEHEKRANRKDELKNIIDFVLVLFHNDEFYRERMGWMIFWIIEHKEEFVFETQQNSRVSFKPEEWFGAETGRGIIHYLNTNREG